MSVPEKPAGAVSTKLPSAATLIWPPVPNVAVAPAAFVVSVPPSVPPPNEATVAIGRPGASLARRPAAAATVYALAATAPVYVSGAASGETRSEPATSVAEASSRPE